jgi:hypothetical protein
MKPSTATKFRVRPFNIKNGNQAPYFIVEPSSSAKKEEVSKLAFEEFRKRSSLSKYQNWDLEVEKI